MSFRHFPLILLLWMSAALPDAHAAPVQTDNAEAELIAENLSFRAGEYENWVALRLRPDPGWHVYWQNPGDSGIPTALKWTLPPGVQAGAIQWPYPHRESLGELTNYGYAEETLHLVPVRVAPGSKEAKLAAKATWLVCKDICIPGEAELKLEVPVSDAEPQPDPAWRGAFEKARAQLPRGTAEWDMRYAVVAGEFSLQVEGVQFPQKARVEFFPQPNDLVAHAATQRVAIDPANGLRLTQRLSDYFVEAPDPVRGVLVVYEGDQARAFEVQAQPGVVAAVAPSGPEMRAAAETPRGAGTAASDATLPAMLLFALVGGLILNLMPCVFPVLAMKSVSLLGAAEGGDEGAHHRRHALAYTAGVVASFVAVAAVLMGLRAGGAALGWGFQLQSPAFVFALAALMFAMGLSLSGLAQFGASWMGLGQGLASRPGLAGSFFTGVLAVVVASPCTAPFMAPAMGFALAQPAGAALLVFAVLGLGLALPFLLIGFVPALAAWLPRPGAWMETFKQLMAFPMYLTAVWLLWVLGGLTDRDGMALALVGLVLVALALWLWSRARGGALQGLAMAVLILAGLLALHPALRARPAGTPAVPARTAEGWEPYSDARFAALRAEGRSVFVDFTADWCLTCKLNERGALRADSVREAFRRRDVVLLVGDWTRADPAITAVLDRYGRSGVPLYLASRAGAEPQVLPQVLTPDVITAAFD